ncbi:MAG TPA: hypothetical protein VNI53_06995 [Gammaproteobacteria bacterium]|nr:hypothetical protein [Gammaproteobacteria bacterium]
MNTTTETTFLHKARTAFVDSLDQLDTRVLARLREARMRAVESATSHPTLWHRRSWALSVGAIAVLLVVLASGVLWWNQNPQPAVPFATGNNNEDMSIVLGNDNLDMYADMDFYRWLQAQQQTAPQSDSGGNSSG